MRKSLLNTLYGIAVAEGRIKLTSTLTKLGIDDKPPALTDAEKQATDDQRDSSKGVPTRAFFELVGNVVPPSP